MGGHERTGFYMHGMDFICIWLVLPKLPQICISLFAVAFLYSSNSATANVTVFGFTRRSNGVQYKADRSGKEEGQVWVPKSIGSAYYRDYIGLYGLAVPGINNQNMEKKHMPMGFMNEKDVLSEF